MPLPVSASFTPPSTTFQGFTTLPGKQPVRPPRVSHHNLSNARPSHRRSKLASKLATGKTLASNTIPIRGLSHTPTTPTIPSRFASSAPAATMSPLASPAAAMSRMTAGGIKPRQTSARMLINAAASQRPGGVAVSRPTPTPDDTSRVRKERSGSLTPGPSHVFGIVDSIVGSNVETDVATGKRVKV